MAATTTNNSYPLSRIDFAPRGLISLSDEARAGASEFLLQLGRFDEASRWIVGFVWSSARSMRENKNSEWIDEGPGIDLAGYRSTELPPDAIETRDGVPVAFVIPRSVIDAAKEKKIVQVRVSSGRLSLQLI